MKLTELSVGDVIIIPHYDALPCVVIRIDTTDQYQPVFVEWEDGTFTWPEDKYEFEVVNK